MALDSGSSGSKVQQGVVVVSHEATRTGAPQTALNVARELAEKRGIPVVTILLKAGELEPEFSRLGPVFIAPQYQTSAYVGDAPPWAQVVKGMIHLAEIAWHGGDDRFWRRIAKYLAIRQIRYAICNTVLSGTAAMHLKQAGLKSIGLVHEMPHSIRTYGWSDQCTALIQGTDALVFASPQVRSAFTNSFSVSGRACHVFPQGCNIDLDRLTGESHAAARSAFRARQGLAADDVLVLGAGYGDFRKGIDLFVQVAREVAAQDLPASGKMVFAWAGQVERKFLHWIAKDVTELGLSDRLIFLGEQRDMAPSFAAADIFFLASREDPFPNVVIEAMASGIPVLGFSGSGGFEEQANEGAGVAVPYADIAGSVRVLHRLAGSPDERMKMGQHGREKVALWGGHHAYVGNLIELLKAGSTTWTQADR